MTPLSKGPVTSRVWPGVMAAVLLGCQGPAPRQAGTTAGAAANPAVGAAAQAPQTDHERRLYAAALIALPPDGVQPESLPDPLSRGAQLLTAYCTQCHALPSPAMHGAQDWPSVARRMWVRIDMLHGELGVTVPGPGDRVALLNYLIANALKVSAHLPPGLVGTPSRRCAAAATCCRTRGSTLPRTGRRSSCAWSATWSASRSRRHQSAGADDHHLPRDGLAAVVRRARPCAGVALRRGDPGVSFPA